MPRHILLVWLGSQHNDHLPWAIVVLHQTIILQLLHQLIYDLGFMWSILMVFAANWFSIPSVNLEGEPSNGSSQAPLTKHIPVVYHHLPDFFLEVLQASLEIEVGLQFFPIGAEIKFQDIIPW